MTDCSKRYPFSTVFKLGLKEIFTKGKTGRAISYGDSRLSSRSDDRRLVNKISWLMTLSRLLRDASDHEQISNVDE
jgi:hypothetical protein